MKKKILALCLSILFCICSATACTNNEKTFSIPANLSITEGLLEWNAVDGAVSGYTVKVNSEEFSSISNSFDLLSASASSALVRGDNAVSVKVNAAGETKASTYSESVNFNYTPAPNTVNIQGNETVVVGESLTFTASVLPAQALQDIQWSVSNEALAEISEAGVLKALGAGSVKVIATAKDTTVKAEKNITINYATATGVTITNTETSIVAGVPLTLAATVAPANASQTVVWSVNDTSTASISGNILTGLKAGEVKLTATASGTTVKSEKTITVTYAVSTDVTVSGAVETDYHTAVQLMASVSPTGANQAVEWSVDETDIAAIDANGLLTPIAGKTGIVTATAVSVADNEKKGTHTIAIKAPLAATLNVYFTGADIYKFYTFTNSNNNADAGSLNAKFTEFAADSAYKGFRKATLDLAAAAGNNKLGFIVTTQDWNKDVSSDRFVDCKELFIEADLSCSIWLVTKEAAIYTDFEAAEAKQIEKFESAVDTWKTSLGTISGNITFPSEINGIAVTWTSAQTSVIANDGNVTRPQGENANVTLNYVSIVKSGSVIVSVLKAYSKDYNAEITLAGTAEVEIGQTVTLTATVTPEELPSKKLIWSVSEGGTNASVNQSGVVTGVAVGTAKIKAALEDDADIYKEFSISVKEKSAIEVTNYEELVAILSTATNQEIQLKNNIDCTGKPAFTPTVTGFNGMFDGQGYRISNFQVTGSSQNAAGLFVSVKGGAVIKNVVFVKPRITTANGNSGILFGRVDSGAGEILVDKVIVIDLITTVTASQYTHGGLIGTINGTYTVKITNCYVEWSIKSTLATGNGGGLVGTAINNAKLTVKNCFVDVVIEVQNTGAIWAPIVGQVGGLTSKTDISYVYVSITNGGATNNIGNAGVIYSQMNTAGTDHTVSNVIVADKSFAANKTKIFVNNNGSSEVNGKTSNADVALTGVITNEVDITADIAGEFTTSSSVWSYADDVLTFVLPAGVKD